MLPCPQRPYDIHSSNAVESLVQLFSTVSVQYVPTWSKEMVALLRKVSSLPFPSPRVPIPSELRETPHLSMGSDSFTSPAIIFSGNYSETLCASERRNLLPTCRFLVLAAGSLCWALLVS